MVFLDDESKIVSIVSISICTYYMAPFISLSKLANWLRLFIISVVCIKFLQQFWVFIEASLGYGKNNKKVKVFLFVKISFFYGND